MKLYKFKDYEYTTNDLFFDKPCEVMGVVLYPIKAKDYEQFLNYAKYIMFSAKHLGINTKEVDLNNDTLSKEELSYIEQIKTSVTGKQCSEEDCKHCKFNVVCNYNKAPDLEIGCFFIIKP